MESKIYKVFISSTFKDLELERRTVINGLLSLKCMPIAMEFFTASDETPAELIRRRMSDCDFYILIVKGKYGSIEQGTHKSYTEMEYDYACANKIPVLSFLYSNRSNLKAPEIDDTKKEQQMLTKFIAKANLLTTAKWDTAENLANKISEALNEQFGKNSSSGFIKKTGDDKPATKTLDEINFQKEKLGYIKFLRLSHKLKTKNALPTKRYIARSDEIIDVYDELILYSVNVFSEEISGFKREDITSGVVDVDILHPWQLYSSDPSGVNKDNSLEQMFENSSSAFVSASYFFNSFQHDQLFKITVEKLTNRATFIFDFSLLPGFQSLINANKVTGWVEDRVHHTKSALQVKTESPWSDKDSRTPGIFCISAENLKKDAALVFDFTEAIEWNKT